MVSGAAWGCVSHIRHPRIDKADLLIVHRLDQEAARVNVVAILSDQTGNKQVSEAFLDFSNVADECGKGGIAASGCESPFRTPYCAGTFERLHDVRPQ